MGYFGYEFLTLSKEQVAKRRIYLDHYANIAQLSQLLVIFLAVVSRFVIHTLEVSTSPGQNTRPGSPHTKYFLQSQSSTWSVVILRFIRRWSWTFGSELIPGYGTLGQWAGGAAWFGWLMLLCVQETVPGKHHPNLRTLPI